MKLPPSSYANYLNEKDTNESFVSYAIKNQLIGENKYFEWAVEYYQIPFLQDSFFDKQHLLTKKQWLKIKDLSPWNPEQLPVVVYEGFVFIACLENPSPLKGSLLLNSSTRFVLTSSQSLQQMWNLFAQFSQSAEEATGLKGPVHSPKPPNLQQEKVSPKLKGVQVSEEKAKASQVSSSTKMPEDRISIEGLSDQMEAKHSLEAPIHSEETKKPLVKPSVKPPVKPLALNENFKAIELKIEEEEGSDQSSTQQIQSSEVESNIIQGNFKQKEQTRREAGETLVEPSSLVSEKDTQSSTKIVRIKGSGTDYEDLWKKTDPFFCASMVLKIRERRLLPLAHTGKIIIQDKDTELVSLNDQSLFRVCDRGHCYHGYVVDVPKNKDFFRKIGWEDYPKHISAIPIKNEAPASEGEGLIFVGLSLKAFSEEKQKGVEKTISDYFSPAQVQQKRSA